MPKERKHCRVVWFDEKDQHVPVKKVKAIMTPRYFDNVRALACKRGEFSFQLDKVGEITAKSMTAKEQAKTVGAKKKKQKASTRQQTLNWKRRG